MSKWLALVRTLAPIILTSVKPELAPIADQITSAITEAEAIKGANGSAKLQHVKNIATNAINSLNVAKGKEILNTNDVNNAVDTAVSTVVQAINLIHKNVKQ
jgi:hypothetical protein